MENNKATARLTPAEAYRRQVLRDRRAAALERQEAPYETRLGTPRREAGLLFQPATTAKVTRLRPAKAPKAALHYTKR